MITPVSALSQSLNKAYLEILVPQNVEGGPIIPLRFNPPEYQLQKSNNFAEIPIPGLESPPIQFVRGASEKLTAELMVDTSDTLLDVRVEYVEKLRKLMDLNSDLHAPPIVRLVWGGPVFTGVLESLNVTYVLFTPEGVPLRAKLNVTLKEYRPVAIQTKEKPKFSPDVEKSFVARRGDTYSSIASALYRDPGEWREIARANGVKDPRRLAPGTVLRIPKLT